MVINCFNMDCVLGSRICCLEIESLPWLLVRFHFLGNFSTYFLPKATPTTSCLFIVEILLIVGKQNSTSASRCRDQQLYFRTDIPLLLVDLRYDSINYQNNSLSWFNFPWLKVSLDHYDGYWIDFTDNRLDPSLINL